MKKMWGSSIATSHQLILELQTTSFVMRCVVCFTPFPVQRFGSSTWNTGVFFNGWPSSSRIILLLAIKMPQSLPPYRLTHDQKPVFCLEDPSLAIGQLQKPYFAVVRFRGDSQPLGWFDVHWKSKRVMTAMKLLRSWEPPTNVSLIRWIRTKHLE